VAEEQPITNKKLVLVVELVVLGKELLKFLKPDQFLLLLVPQELADLVEIV
jgi:hypothetical protein